jgi:hypothetical protein
MIDYITLEDQIITKLQDIEYSNKSEYAARYEAITDDFKICWTDFQDDWDNDMWSVYNTIRNGEDIKHTNDNSILEDFEKLKESRVSTHNDEDEVFITSLHLQKIDYEIDNIQNGNCLLKERRDEKRRGCGDCLLF